MDKIINKQRARNSVNALNQLTQIRINLANIKKYQGVYNNDKSEMDNMVDGLNVDFHFKMIERDLNTITAHLGNNLKATGWEAKPSEYSDGHLVLDKVVAESAYY